MSMEQLALYLAPWWSHCARCSGELTRGICPLPENRVVFGFGRLLCAPCAGFDVDAWLARARNWRDIKLSEAA